MFTSLSLQCILMSDINFFISTLLNNHEGYLNSTHFRKGLIIMKRSISKMLLLMSVFAVLMNFNTPDFSAFEPINDNLVETCDLPDPIWKK